MTPWVRGFLPGDSFAFFVETNFSFIFNVFSWAWKYIQLPDVLQAVLLGGNVRRVILCSDFQLVTLFLSHFSSCLLLPLSSWSFSVPLLLNTSFICFACYRKALRSPGGSLLDSLLREEIKKPMGWTCHFEPEIVGPLGCQWLFNVLRVQSAMTCDSVP